MSRRSFRALFVAGSLALLVACEKAPEPPADGLLQHVPADTPYAFVTSKLLGGALDALSRHNVPGDAVEVVCACTFAMISTSLRGPTAQPMRKPVMP